MADEDLRQGYSKAKKSRNMSKKLSKAVGDMRTKTAVLQADLENTARKLNNVRRSLEGNAPVQSQRGKRRDI